MQNNESIFERTHIQHLRAFLMEELEATHIDHNSYEDRLEKAHRPVTLTSLELLLEQKDREAIYEATTMPIMSKNFIWKSACSAGQRSWHSFWG